MYTLPQDSPVLKFAELFDIYLTVQTIFKLIKHYENIHRHFSLKRRSDFNVQLKKK